MIQIGNIQIADDELEFHFVRSSGAGGQNVNKVASKAVLRWHFTDSKLHPAIKERFAARFGMKITSDGDVVISSDRYRDQPRNMADAIAKLTEMISQVIAPPRARKKTKPTKGSVERRLKEKKLRSSNKSQRRKVSYD